jgi:extracellular factor (EF) 3-hydroxypalmitic acid methyl ester biosynthesis protein
MLHAVVERLHGVLRWIEVLHAQGADSDAIALAVAPAVRATAHSPFAARLHTWPRGYPGDFETIEYLCDGINTAEPGTLAYFCEAYCLNTPLAHQHRYKLEAQADILRHTVIDNPDAAILVLAAGGGRDLLKALPWLERSRATIVINDIDRDALALCERRLASLGPRLRTVPGDARLSLARFESERPFDLVLAGGLFDYIPTPLLVRMLQRIIRRLLSPHGLLFFTNIASGHAFSGTLRYLLNWPLIERSDDDLMTMLAAAGVPRDVIRHSRDVTGFTHLVQVSLEPLNRGVL